MEIFEVKLFAQTFTCVLSGLQNAQSPNHVSCRLACPILITCYLVEQKEIMKMDGSLLRTSSSPGLQIFNNIIIIDQLFVIITKISHDKAKSEFWSPISSPPSSTSTNEANNTKIMKTGRITGCKSNWKVEAPTTQNKSSRCLERHLNEPPTRSLRLSHYHRHFAAFTRDLTQWWRQRGRQEFASLMSENNDFCAHCMPRTCVFILTELFDVLCD